MADGASEAPTPLPGTPSRSRADILTVAVEVGRRAMIVANLGLGPTPTTASTWAASGLARTLDTWEGPGLVVIAGNLFDLTTGGNAATALGSHPRLARPSRPSPRRPPPGHRPPRCHRPPPYSAPMPTTPAP